MSFSWNYRKSQLILYFSEPWLGITEKKTYAVCDEHLTCVTLTLHFRDDDETVPEKANESVAVSEAVEPTSMYTLWKINLLSKILKNIF